MNKNILQLSQGRLVLVPWVQPQLSSNGTPGVDDLAVRCSDYVDSNWDAWRSFNNAAPWAWLSHYVAPQSLDFCSKVPIQVSRLSVYIPNENGYNTGQPKDLLYQVCDDGVNFNTVYTGYNLVNSLYATYSFDIPPISKLYKWHRLYVSSTVGAGSAVSIGKITITARKKPGT